jgi:biotin transport system substrate-specific component
MRDPRGSGVRRVLNDLNRRRLHFGPQTLADRVFTHALFMDVVLILCGAALVAMSSQFVVPLWPVPSTGQIIGVLIVGYTLGSVRGGLALILYIAMGLAGLPVFNQGASGWTHFAGPTGGYLVGFVAAAVLAGLCAARGWDRRFWSNLLCSALITALVYAFGVARLLTLNGFDLAQALQDGFTPLVFAGGVKVIVAAALVSKAWRIDISLHRKAAAAGPRPKTTSLRG